MKPKNKIAIYNHDRYLVFPFNTVSTATLHRRFCISNQGQRAGLSLPRSHDTVTHRVKAG